MGQPSMQDAGILPQSLDCDIMLKVLSPLREASIQSMQIGARKN